MNMWTETLLVFILLTFSFTSWGQDSTNNQGQLSPIRCMPTITKETKPPLYIIKSEKGILQLPTDNRLKKLLKDFKLDWINSFEVLKDKSATEKYGSLGQNGVIIINLKEGTYDILPRRLKKYKTSE